MINKCLSILALVALGGCANAPMQSTTESLALASGFAKVEILAEPFTLTGFVRSIDSAQPLRVYIEGDGHAWVTDTQPSSDPTPRNPIGLQLAIADPTGNVAYLARPCQFTPLKTQLACNVTYWTDRRYSEPVVRAVDQAVSALKRSPSQKIELVGYSGGGAVALLVASRRIDVASIRTVAGNLDTDKFTQLHGLTPLAGSINPMTIASKLAAIPQIHFAGVEDRIVPASLVGHFVDATGPCAQMIVVTGMSHGSDWAARWNAMINEQPACRVADRAR